MPTNLRSKPGVASLGDRVGVGQTDTDHHLGDGPRLAAETKAEFARVGQYLRDPYLIIVSCPFIAKPDGRLYVTDEWRRDLQQHFPYIRNLLLAGPVVKAGSDQIPLFELQSIVPKGVRVEAVRLPDDNSLLKGLGYLPAVIAKLWRAVRNAQIVHCDVLDGGHIYPYGLVAVPIAWLNRRFIVNFVENIGMQLDKGRASWVHRLQSNVLVAAAKWCLARAHVVFTSYEASRDVLLGKDSAKTHVLPYVYLLEEELIDTGEAERLWEEKQRAFQPVRMCVATRLVASKGIGVLLDALRRLIAEGVPLEFHVYGAGPLEGECRAVADASTERTRVVFKGTLPYGPVFLETLRRYHLVVIPSISDEQPRILFDSFSQATPVLASRTLGMARYAELGQGILVEPGDVESLTRALREIANDPTSLRERAMAGLRLAQQYNIQGNHRRRAAITLYALARWRAESETADER